MVERRLQPGPQLPETWRGATAYREGLSKVEVGDLSGALHAFVDAAGPEEYEENAEDDRPFVIAALIAAASTLDEMGHFEAAVRSYDLASELT